MSHESINLILRSNACVDTHPSNSTSMFTNIFPEEVNVENYHVALETLIIDPNFSYLPPALREERACLLLFTDEDSFANGLPHKEINISGHSNMTLEGVIKQLLRTLTLDREDFLEFTVTAQKLTMVVNECILLIAKNVCDFFHFPYDNTNFPINSPQQYKENYIVINALSQQKKMRGRKKVIFKKQVPKYIRVILNEMEQTLSSKAFHKDLAIIHTKKFADVLFHTVKIKEYFKFEPDNLKELSVTLTDENYTPLYLPYSTPTTVVLDLKKIMSKSRILRISSRDCGNIFQDNTNTNFKIQLQAPVDLAVRTEVALTSIMLPTDIDHAKILNENEDFFIQISYEGVDQIWNEVNLEFEDDDFQSRNHFLNKLTAEIAEKSNNLATAEFEEVENEVKIAFGTEVTILFSKLAINLFNKTPNDVLTRNGKKMEVFMLFGQPDQEITFGKLSFMRANPNFLYVNCNFISPTITGNRFSKTLKIVPLNFSGSNEMIRHDASHLDFFPISMNDNSVLNFQLYVENNKFYPVKNNQNEVIITLLFREKIGQ